MRPYNMKHKRSSNQTNKSIEYHKWTIDEKKWIKKNPNEFFKWDVVMGPIWLFWFPFNIQRIGNFFIE